MIRGCDGICRWHEDGKPLTKEEPMSMKIRSRFSNIDQDEWDRIFKKGKYSVPLIEKDWMKKERSNDNDKQRTIQSPSRP